MLRRRHNPHAEKYKTKKISFSNDVASHSMWSLGLELEYIRMVNIHHAYAHTRTRLYYLLHCLFVNYKNLVVNITTHDWPAATSTNNQNISAAHTQLKYTSNDWYPSLRRICWFPCVFFLFYYFTDLFTNEWKMSTNWHAKVSAFSWMRPQYTHNYYCYYSTQDSGMDIIALSIDSTAEWSR